MLGLALVHDRRRRRPRRSEEELIANRLNALIVPVADLGPSEGRTLVAVPDFASLAGLAHFLERPILYEARDGKRTYAVDDDALRYVTPAKDRRQAREPDDVRSTDRDETPRDRERVPSDTRPHRKQATNPSGPAHGSAKGSIVARGGAALLAVAVVSTLTVSLTASNTVPVSRASKVFYGGAVSQGAPTGCSAVAANLTSLVQHTGTFSNSTSNALILGGSGVDKITDTGNYNCIVAGGGKDNVTARSTSVCIIGPSSGTSYSGCTKKN